MPIGATFLLPSGATRLGGYQVLKKWLSYRERAILGRSLTPDEVQYFTDTARRDWAILLVSSEHLTDEVE